MEPIRPLDLANHNIVSITFPFIFLGCTVLQCTRKIVKKTVKHTGLVSFGYCLGLLWQWWCRRCSSIDRQLLIIGPRDGERKTEGGREEGRDGEYHEAINYVDRCLCGLVRAVHITWTASVYAEGHVRGLYAEGHLGGLYIEVHVGGPIMPRGGGLYAEGHVGGL